MILNGAFYVGRCTRGATSSTSRGERQPAGSIGEPDLKAFEQIKELRSTNKRLTDEVKRLTTEGVQLAFKNRQLDQQAKKFQQESADSIARLQEELAETVAKLNHELSEAVARSQRLDHSVEELQGELIKSREQMLSHEAENCNGPEGRTGSASASR